MRFLPFLFAVLVSSCSIFADNNAAPAYRAESKLPEGWPSPGPYDKVSQKTYPAYRAAFSTNTSENGAFWTLFGHIKKNSIPMTAPVEMEMKTTDKGMKQASMAFLYQNTQVGKTGEDGKNVLVKDIPARKALSYTWMGPNSKETIAKAKAAIQAELKKQKLTATEFRLLGYNGPRTPRSKKTWELQALLPIPKVK